MAVKRVSVVVGADALAVSVEFWKSVLGIDPTFVDGERWAQFDVGGARLSLGAGAERPATTSVMVAVDDLDGFRASVAVAAASAVVDGPHERRVTFSGPAGETVIVYQAK